MTKSFDFHVLPLDLAPFSGKRCRVTYRNGNSSSGTLVVNDYNGKDEINRSYPWRFNPDSSDGFSESYTSQGTVMKNCPNLHDIVSIKESKESVKPEQASDSELADRVAELESKLEILLRHFHELSSEL